MRRLILFIVAVVACLHVTVVGSQEPAQAAPCKVLQPAELRFDAPRLTATVTPAQDACWILPDEAGTVYQLGLDALSPLPPLFTNSDGTDACSEASALGTCALVGEAPFTMTTSPLSFAPALDVTYQVFRLSGDTGCPPIATSAFGAAR